MDRRSAGFLVVFIVIVIILAVAIIFIISRRTSTNGISVSEEINTVLTGNTIGGTAQANENLSSFISAIKTAGLTSMVTSPDQSFTVFAPNNTAFANAKSILDILMETGNKTKLDDTLKYHIVNSKLLVGNLTDGQIIQTLNGLPLKVRIIKGETYINNAKIIQGDINASNGVIHILDEVLLPGTFSDMSGTIADAPNLSTFLNAITLSDLSVKLANANAGITVFAPINTAFSNIQDTTNSLLKTENKSQLQNTINNHMIETEIFSKEMTNGQVIKTMGGASLTISIENGTIYVSGKNGKAKVIDADIKTSNGVIYYIDKVLLP
jgi:transforming growth factor-beta-induced protein